ncbi:MAG: hypothetical protein JNK48_31740 [Bryobacterales bacterium]|nr:hypothetical protein [Bryobacterales bacterium]
MLQLTFLLISLWNPAYAQKAPYDCGNLGQKACNWKQFERYNMRWGTHKCEADLEERDGICVNKNRITRPKDAGWIGWAIREQLHGISQHQPINRIPWYSAHNAFSSRRQGFPGDIYANQLLSVTDQLNAGVRHIEIDPHYYNLPVPTGGVAVRLCHASHTSLCFVPNYGTRLFGFLLAEVRAWLRANPDEIIVVKLNDQNVNTITGLGDDFMYSELEEYLGGYAYRPRGAYTRWPTLSEIRSAGKQVVLMQHDNNVPAAGEDLVWDAHTFLQSNNWPDNQDFNNCVSHDGVNQANRGAKEWWDVAEGRSLSNANTEITNFTGLLTEARLRRAVNCGASILGVDFVQALSSAPVGNRPNNKDERLYSTIWSWAENDFGVNGPAYLNPNTRRWHSVSINEQKPFACARKRSYGDPNDVRDWRITSAIGAWNLSLANAMCVAEFGSDFEFAHPGNGYQNRQLADLAANKPDGVWVKYSTELRGFVAASTSEVVFTAAPGATSIPAQMIDFYAFAGTQAFADTTVPWLQAQALAAVVPSSGVVPVTLTPVGEIVRSMAPGEYKTNVQLRSVRRVGGSQITFPLNVEVTLIIRKPVSFTIAPEQTPVSYGLRARVVATLPQLTPKITGTLSFLRTSAPEPELTVVNVEAVNGQYVDFNGLPAGKHRFAVSYSGDSYYLPAESNEIEIEILPRIRVTPNAVTFTMDFGGAVPGGQNLAVAGAAAGLSVTRPCGWLTATVQSQTLIALSLIAAQVQPLAPGAYDCPVTVSDSQSATQGSTILPVVLNVRTTLSASPATWDVTTASDSVVREIFLTTPGNRVAPVTAVANQPWLSVLVPNGATPTNMVISANPTGLAPGIHTARINITSPLASNTAFVDVTLRVVRETVVDTVPTGLRVVVDGAPLIAPASFVWIPGSVHQITTDTFQEQPNGIRYRFANWQHGGAQTQNVAATTTGGVSYFANFTAEYRLSTDAVPAGAGSILRNPAGDGSGYYAPNATVQLTAQANPGKAFHSWSGNASGTNPITALLMNAPKSAIANFADVSAIQFPVQSPVTAAITVNGTSYPVPGNVPMVPGLTYTIAAPAEVSGGAGIRWAFSSWQGLAATPGFNYVAPASPTTLNLVYQQQYLVTATASPSAGGTVAGGGWINAGAGITLQATAASGFQFSGFSGGGLTAASGNPASIAAVTAPLSIVANFATTGTPNLFASTSAARTDGPGAGQRTVPLSIRNVGSGPAADAAITAITNVTVLAGSGAVSAATTVPLPLGTIASGGQAATSLVFNWPATATRVQFTVRFSANGGAYNGSTTLTLFR